MPGEQAWIRMIEVALGVRHAIRSRIVSFWASPRWLRGRAVALSGEVHDGRGAEFLRRDVAGPARGPAVRRRGPLHVEGRRSQESAEVGQLLRLPGRLPRASGGM